MILSLAVFPEVAKSWDTNKLRHPDEGTKTEKWTDWWKQLKCVFISVSSVLIGWLLCWGAAAVVFCGFQRSGFFSVFFFFFKRHLVPPPPLYIWKQVLTPPPTNPMFALPFSLTGKKTSRLLAVEHFGRIRTVAFPRSSPCCGNRGAGTK